MIYSAHAPFCLSAFSFSQRLPFHRNDWRRLTCFEAGLGSRWLSWWAKCCLIIAQTSTWWMLSFRPWQKVKSCWQVSSSGAWARSNRWAERKWSAGKTAGWNNWISTKGKAITKDLLSGTSCCFHLLSHFQSGLCCSERLVPSPAVMSNECSNDSGVTHYSPDTGREQRLLTLFACFANVITGTQLN